jgi:CelD/BcsL family acetyltransferase involved in cellulose biosynthesis
VSEIVQVGNARSFRDENGMSVALIPPPSQVQPALVTIDDWQSFVSSHPCSTPFHHRNWLELISVQYHLPICIYGLMRAGEMVAGIPFLETRTMFGRRQLICLPLSDNMRILARDSQTAADLATGLREMSFAPYARVLMKTDQPTNNEPTPMHVVRHELDVSRSLDVIEKQYASSLVRNIKRAKRNQLQFETRTDEQSLWRFYELHVATRRKLGIPVQPRSFFRRLHQKMIATGQGGVAEVRKDGQVISAVVFLKSPHTMIYKYAASDVAMLDLRPNDFMLYHLIRLAVDRGLSALDFGTSQFDETGLRRFKSKWGAEETEVFADCFHGLSDRSAVDSKLMSAMRGVIRRSPQFVCRGLGELFYRFHAS